MKGTSLVAGLLIGSALCVGAQSPRPPQPRDTSKTFFTRADLYKTAAILAASGVVSIFDERIGHWTQSENIQGPGSRHDAAENLTVVNETPLTLAAVATYGVGRLVHNETVADVGLHLTESLVLTVGMAEAIRGPLGRLRPRASPDDAFHFKAGRGFTDFAARSYPSIHAAVAFATATSLVGEVRIRKPQAVKYVAPPLYAAALIPGFTRMYLNQHWASDVVAGTLMGALLGTKVVHYAHTHRRNRIDRLLLGMTALPDGHGNVRVGTAFSP
jgi:membrane-associated phospholipid phosphatase